MKIYQLAAVSENNVIGADGKIPWQISEDLKRFREITLGHPVIMGRLTFESMRNSPLKGRFNIVLTSRDTLTMEGGLNISREDGIINLTERFPNTEIALASSIEEALSLLENPNDHGSPRTRGWNEVYVIGGSHVYEQMMDLTDELRLTIIHSDVKGGDAFYPEIDETVWAPSYIEPGEEYSYIDYVRRL